MKYIRQNEIAIKRVGGYSMTVSAALGSAYLINNGNLWLGLAAIGCSFAANYYADFVAGR